MKKIIISAILCGVIGLTFIGCSEQSAVVNSTEEASKEKLTQKITEEYSETTPQSEKANDVLKEYNRDIISLIETEDLNENKEYIFDRMLNTIDFINTIEGQYYFSSIKGDAGNQCYFVDYHIKIDDTAETIETLVNDAGEFLFSTYYDGESILTYNEFYLDSVRPIDGEIRFDFSREEVNKIFYNAEINNFDERKVFSSYSKYSDYKDSDTVASMNSVDRVKVNETGEDVYYYRRNLTNLTHATESVLPQYLVIGTLFDFDAWNIVEEEKILDRECYLIEAILNDSYKEQMDSSIIKMWVDIKTGVLLKYDLYNGDELMERLETVEVSFNNQIDSKVFETEMKAE